DTDINTYKDRVIGYIDDVIPRITVQSFPNQKPWVNGEVRAKLKARTDAYNSGDLEEYRKSRYALRRAISSAKRQYRDKVESHYKGSNTRSMWAGLKTITDYKKKISSAEHSSSTIMKCFEQLVKSSSSPFPSRPHWTHFSLPTGPIAFNTIVPSKLVTKLRDLGLNSALCDWILNFLTSRPQAVRMGSTTSSILTLNTRRPPGLCAQPSAVLPVHTHDCVATHSSNTIVKFADDKTIIGLITTGDDETAYREEDYGGESHSSFRFLQFTSVRTSPGLITLTLSQSQPDSGSSSSAGCMEAQHGLKDPLQLLQVHHREDPDWLHHRLVQQLHQPSTVRLYRGMVKAAQHITRTELPSMEDLYTQRCRKKATKIIKDPSHPASHKLFCLLPSGRRFCSIRAEPPGSGTASSRRP
ncbi:hypothetical protein L3Q82_023461, partial [Scortum barcoo]